MTTSQRYFTKHRLIMAVNHAVLARRAVNISAGELEKVECNHFPVVGYENHVKTVLCHVDVAGATKELEVQPALFNSLPVEELSK